MSHLEPTAKKGRAQPKESPFRLTGKTFNAASGSPYWNMHYAFRGHMVVDNLPHATFNGKDAQLEAAIAYLKEQIRKHPVDIPEPPPYPDKSFKTNTKKD